MIQEPSSMQTPLLGKSTHPDSTLPSKNILDNCTSHSLSLAHPTSCTPRIATLCISLVEVMDTPTWLEPFPSLFRPRAPYRSKTQPLNFSVKFCPFLLLVRRKMHPRRISSFTRPWKELMRGSLASCVTEVTSFRNEAPAEDTRLVVSIGGLSCFGISSAFCHFMQHLLSLNGTAAVLQ